jgi:site-specific DNA recombinase
MVMNLTARAREIFENSKVDEKCQLLNFVFQNLKLDGKNLSIDTYKPFNTLVDYKRSPKGWGKLDLNQRPAGYEGGGPPYNSAPSNRYG